MAAYLDLPKEAREYYSLPRKELEKRGKICRERTVQLKTIIEKKIETNDNSNLGEIYEICLTNVNSLKSFQDQTRPIYTENLELLSKTTYYKNQGWYAGLGLLLSEMTKFFITL